MIRLGFWRLASVFLLNATGLAGCAITPDRLAERSMRTSFPERVNAFGTGYPVAGAPCRRLGESPATADYLDHTAILAGCLNPEDAQALGGRIVGHIDGVWLVSTPNKTRHR